MDPTVMRPPDPDRGRILAGQTNIDAVVGRFRGVDERWEYDALPETKHRFAHHCLPLSVVEDRPPMPKTVLGRPGRDAAMGGYADVGRPFAVGYKRGPLEATE